MYTENTNLIEYVEQVEAENSQLKGFLASMINEVHREHYGDAALAYSEIKDIIQEVEKRLGDKGNEYQPVKHGRWELVKSLNTPWRCTNCGEAFGAYDHPICGGKYIEIERIYKYCPNCGAEMGKEAVE